MKKLLRSLFILLLLALSFLYIVKNPELAISEKILTTLGIDIQGVKDNLNYGGIGVGLDTSTSYEGVSYPVITYVYKNSPAFNIGLETYDIITMIDNESVKDQSPDTVSAKLRGSIGSKVVLIIERPQANNKRMRIEKNITRAIIEVSFTPTYEYTLDGNPITQYTQRIESILACEKNIVLVEQDPIGDSSGTLDGYFVRIGKSIPIRNRIKKYAIQQPNGDWVEYNLGDPNPSYPETKNSRSDFTDHTFKILECNEYATGDVVTEIFVNDIIFIKETIDRTKKIGDEEPNQDFVIADYIINQSGFSVYVLDTSKISGYDILIATGLSELTTLERYPSTLLNNILTDWRMIDFGHENWVHELTGVQVPNTDFSRVFVAFEGQAEANLVFYIVFRKGTYLVKIDFHPSYLEKSGPLSPTLEKTIQKFYDGQETMRNSEVRDNSDMASEEFKTYRINEFKTYYNNNLAKDTEYNNFLDTVINNAISRFAIK